MSGSAAGGAPFRVIDLSCAIDFAPSFYGPSGGEYFPTTTVAAQGVANATVSLDLHSGTHIDPPAHFVEGAKTIDELPPEHFIRAAVVADVQQCEPKHAIHPSDLTFRAGGWDRVEGKALLLHTGWTDRMYGTREYYPEAPYLTEELAVKIVEAGVSIVVLDCPPDRLDLDVETDRLRLSSNVVHRTLLGNGVPIVENARSMDTISGGDLWLIALPLRIEDGCGSPTRAVVLEWG